MLVDTSLPKMMLDSCQTWARRLALTTKVRSGFVSLSYTEFEQKVLEYARGLRSIGIEKGSRVALMSENCVEWALLDWAILSVGAVTVPIYPTLLEDQVGYILKDAGATVAFAGEPKLAERIEKSAKQQGMQLLVPVMHGGGLGNYTLESMLDEGKQNAISAEEWRQQIATIDPNSTATIIYTSGTTGEPKGAVLSHRAFTFLCAAIRANLPVDHTDKFLSFLPLCHVYERMAGHFLPIHCGAEIVYAESLRTLAQDIVSAKPTILLTVPRFLESVRAKILASVMDAPSFRKKIFNMALSRGKQRIENQMKPVGFLGATLDKVVGAKIRDRFGGRIRFLASGGAALPPDLAEFYGAFGLLILQAYGLTETAPVITCNDPRRNDYTSVGEVLPGVEVSIAEDGEILMRGKSLMDGYLNKPEDTKQAIDEQGWFHTGDLGRLEKNRLWITGRKKDIIVLANGKNVGPERIENMLKASPYIEEVMVFGDDMDYLGALIIPMQESLKIFCKEGGMDCSHMSLVVGYPQIRDLIKSEIDKVNKLLPEFERVKKFALIADKWSQETGEVTPTLKIKRRVIREKYASVMKSLS